MTKKYEPSQADIEGYVAASDGDITEEEARAVLLKLHDKQAESQAGEFTKKIRMIVERVDSSRMVDMRKLSDNMILEACDRLDAKQQENRNLQTTVSIQTSKLQEQHEYIEGLTAENAKLKERIEMLSVENGILWQKAQAEGKPVAL